MGHEASGSPPVKGRFIGDADGTFHYLGHLVPHLYILPVKDFCTPDLHSHDLVVYGLPFLFRPGMGQG